MNMLKEVVMPVLASLGGATIIVAAFAHFLGKVWTDRIAKSTSAKFDSELEAIKSNNIIALEEFKAKSSVVLRERENFAGISHEFYQIFFKKRVETYQKLLGLKNKYISDIEEEFLTDELDSWGIVYHSTFTSMRKLMIENQLYVSNDLDVLFRELRTEASEYIKEAGLIGAITYYDPDTPVWEKEELNDVYDRLAKNTSEKMNAVLIQIGVDVSKLRSRIEIDRA